MVEKVKNALQENWILLLLVALTGGGSAFGVNMTNNNGGLSHAQAQEIVAFVREQRVWRAGLDTTRFTSSDGADLERKMDERMLAQEQRTAQNLLEINRTLGTISAEVASIPKEVPPKWFLERVTKLEDKVEKVEEYLFKTR